MKLQKISWPAPLLLFGVESTFLPNFRIHRNELGGRIEASAVKPSALRRFLFDDASPPASNSGASAIAAHVKPENGIFTPASQVSKLVPLERDAFGAFDRIGDCPNCFFSTKVIRLVTLRHH